MKPVYIDIHIHTSEDPNRINTDYNCDVLIEQVTDETKINFSYIDMIKELYEERKIEAANFESDFTDGEQESVKALIDEINKHTQDFFEQDNSGISENS